ncbi:helix-turn-helix domain-containing protein [Blastopirellula marina]
MSRDTLLTVKQVAEYFQVKPLTVYRWIESGLLPASKLRRSWRIRQADADNMLTAPSGHGMSDSQEACAYDANVAFLESQGIKVMPLRERQ